MAEEEAKTATITGTDPNKKDGGDEKKKKARRFKLPGLPGKKKGGDGDAPKEDKKDKKEKKKKKKDKQEEVEVPEKPISPQEAINNLDTVVEVFDHSKETQLDVAMNEQIKQVEKNMVTIRIKKTKFLLLSGIALATMWLVVGSQFVYTNFIAGKDLTMPELPFLNRGGDEESEEASESAEPEAEEASESASIKVRIKDSSGEEGAADALAEIIKGFEYDLVEVVEDEESNSGVSVVTKSGGEALQTEILSAIEADYQIASPSAVLSDESDFDVVILFGTQE